MKFFIASFTDIIINGNAYADVRYNDNKGKEFHRAILKLSDALAVSNQLLTAPKKILHDIAAKSCELDCSCDGGEVQYYLWCEMKALQAEISQRIAMSHI